MFRRPRKNRYMPDVSSVCDKITEILSYDPLHPILFSSGLFLFLFAGFAFFYQFMRRAVMLRMIYVVLFSLYFYYKTSGLFLFLLVGMSVSDYVIGRFPVPPGSNRCANGS